MESFSVVSQLMYSTRKVAAAKKVRKTGKQCVETTPFSSGREAVLFYNLLPFSDLFFFLLLDSLAAL